MSVKPSSKTLPEERDALLERVRAALYGVEGISEMKMFGGVGFMLGGNLLAAASKRGLLLRLGKEKGLMPFHGRA